MNSGCLKSDSNTSSNHQAAVAARHRAHIPPNNRFRFSATTARSLASCSRAHTHALGVERLSHLQLVPSRIINFLLVEAIYTCRHHMSSKWQQFVSTMRVAAADRVLSAAAAGVRPILVALNPVRDARAAPVAAFTVVAAHTAFTRLPDRLTKLHSAAASCASSLGARTDRQLPQL